MNTIKFIVPFYYTYEVRYFKGYKLLSFLFGECLQQLLYIYIYTTTLNFPLYLIFFALFWSVYEIGYIVNDTWSILREQKPNNRISSRQTFSVDIVIAAKVMLTLFLMVFICFFEGQLVAQETVIMVLAISLIFQLHNTIVDAKFRLITFALLGIFRQLFIIVVFGVPIFIYAFFLVPFLTIKLFDYLFSKGFMNFNLREDLCFRFLYYLAWWIPIFLFVSLELWVVYLVMFVNQNKRYLYEIFKVGGGAGNSK